MTLSQIPPAGQFRRGLPINTDLTYRRKDLFWLTVLKVAVHGYLVLILADRHGEEVAHFMESKEVAKEKESGDNNVSFRPRLPLSRGLPS